MDFLRWRHGSRPAGADELRRDLLACALLACIALVLFGRAPVQGGVLVPTDAIYDTPFFADNLPAGYHTPSNPLLLDQVYQSVPWRRYAWTSLRAGAVPWWNPYSHAGAPFVATMQSAVFYPINLLLLCLPFHQAFAWSAILRLWVAGTLTYLLARQYRLSQAASLVSALAFMLSSFLITWLGHAHTNVAIWLPGIVLADELLLTASDRAGRVRWAFLLAVLVGIQFTGGHPETSADVLVAATMYHVLRWSQVVLPEPVSARTKLDRLLVWPSLAVGLGVALASIQLVPFLEWLPLSAEYDSRSAEAGLQLLSPGWWRYSLSLPLAIFPNLYGNPSWAMPPYRSLLPWGQNFNEDVLYVGVLPLILGIMSLLAWRGRRPEVTVWAVVGGIALGRALQWPIFDWLNEIPVLDLGNPHRERLIWEMSMAMLAGFGAELWWDARSERQARLRRYWIRLNAAVVAAGVGLAILGAGILPLMRGRLTAVARHAADVEFARTGALMPLSHYYERADQGVEKLLWSFRLDNISLYLPAIISAAALVATLWMLRGPAPRRRAYQVALVSLTILDLMAFAWRYNPVIPARAFYPATAVTSQVARDTSLFRFSATGLDLFPDAQMMYGLSDVRSLDFSTRWFSRYVALIPETRAWSSYGTMFDRFTSPLLQVLNLKYVYSTSPGSPWGADSADMVLATKSGRVWRLNDVQPRSFIVTEALLAPSDSSAARLLRACPQAVYSRVVLAAVGPSSPAGCSPRSTGPDGSSVTVLRYGASEAAWEVRFPVPGYLVTTDAYYPGWRAFVDGRETRVYRANIAFRAIRVPAGEHRVIYRYEPSWLAITQAVELLSVLLAAAGLVWSWRRPQAVRPAIADDGYVGVGRDQPPRR